MRAPASGAARSCFCAPHRQCTRFLMHARIADSQSKFQSWMAASVNAPDCQSGAARPAGSSPAPGTSLLFDHSVVVLLGKPDRSNGHSKPELPIAITASVRFVTLMALRMAVTWFLTVGKAIFNVRDIALLLLPFMMSPKTSTCRLVRPKSAGFTGLVPEATRPSPGLGSGRCSRKSISGGV